MNQFKPVQQSKQQALRTYCPFMYTVLGTMPILRQQRNWVDGFRKMAIFADIQYHL